jgi:hypothetical protein
VVLKSTHTHTHTQTFYNNRSETVDLLTNFILHLKSEYEQETATRQVEQQMQIMQFYNNRTTEDKDDLARSFPLITFATISNCYQEEDHTTRPLGRVRLFIRKLLHGIDSQI